MFTMFGKRKQAKMQQLEDPTQSNVDSLNNAKREVTRHFRKKRENIRKPKLLNLKLTLRPQLSKICTGAQRL